MKLPIENLTLIYINKKPIDFLCIYHIIFLNFFIVFIISLLFFGKDDNNKYLPIVMVLYSIFFDIILIKNFIEDKKGASDYIGYTSNYIQFRLPEYSIQHFARYYFLRKIENNILISNIQHIQLKPHYWISFNNLTTKTEISVIFTLNQNMKKLRLNIEHNEVNDFIDKFKQFANNKNIAIQTFEYLI
ncbi:MAG: hypothetical protein IJ143_10025 [Neisseriaceae bacterium]|nr:hypothetical protein [Neisseriaceae bacterium]